MADLPELSEWASGIYQLETSDPVLGGPEGIDNLQAKQLANRTRWLKEQLEQLDHKQSVLYSTKAAIALAGLGVQAGGDWATDLPPGVRVLVKDQAAGTDNGFYLSSGGAWVRASDADSSAEVTPGLVVAVEQGTTLADTRWQLVTDGPIILGTTALTFQNVTAGYAPLASPTFTGDPKAPTPAQFDNDTSLMTTAFAKRMGVEFSGFNSINASATLTNSSVGGIVSAASASPINMTLPPTAGIPHGAALMVVSAGAGAVTLLASGADLLTNQSGAQVPIVLGLGDSALLVKVTGEWRLLGGSVSLKYTAVFGSSLGASGYKKIPDANSPTGYIIEQWGTTGVIASGANLVVPLTIAFPNGIHKCLTTFAQGTDIAAGGSYVGQTRAYALNSVTIRNLGPASAQYDFRITGY